MTAEIKVRSLARVAERAKPGACVGCGSPAPEGGFGKYSGQEITHCAACRAKRPGGRKAMAFREGTPDHHAPMAAMGPTAPGRGTYLPLDTIEVACPGCTLRWDGEAWTHGRGCMMRRARLPG